MAKSKKVKIAEDGLPAPDVGPWIEDKHGILRAYLRYQAGPRKKWLSDERQNGATYIDLFCGAGMAYCDEIGFVDGSAVMAWKLSAEQDEPFSKVLIADADPRIRDACATRLRRLGAPVVELEGDAIEAASALPREISAYGLHFAFLDPFSLGSLSFELIKTLTKFRRIDIIAHVSAMDLFRNYARELKGEMSEFDAFAPGWRSKVAPNTKDEVGRRAIIDYWKGLIETTGKSAEAGTRQVKNSVNRDLYWLMLIGSNELASKFWKLVLEQDSPQKTLL
jgi:three-Cys-motif partner protein